MKRKVNYAVVGLGYIAQAAVLPAFEHARRNSVLAAIVSGDEAKRRKLSRRYGIPHAYDYEDFEACLESAEIDAVYLALPNHMHREYTLRAARAGAHVLCEKPMAVTEKECGDMIDAAERSGVKLMIAYRLHYEPANLEAVAIVRSGKLGEPRLFESVFTLPVEDEENIRLSRRKGGGPLYDIGIYCVNAARYLFRDEPEEVFAMTASRDDPRFDSVEETLSATLRFPGERIASFTCSFGAAGVDAYRVAGTKGDLRVEPAYKHAGDLVHHLTLRGKTTRKVYAGRDQFAPLLLDFSDAILEDRDPEPSGREGLADVRVLRALYRSAEARRPVRLEPFDPGRRPERSMAKGKPPVRKPRMVKASPPRG